jgi:hypothetical protein
LRRNQPEKVIQAQVVALLRSIGAQVYVLGTRRPRGDHPGTCQTPGLPDLYAFLPQAPLRLRYGPLALWVEVKAAGGRASAAQETFVDQCQASDVPHVIGGVDDVLAFLVVGGWVKADNVPHYRRPSTVLEGA